MGIFCLNPHDKPYTKYAFHITIGYHCSFDGLVFADCLSDAIDLIIDHWQDTEADNPGYFMSEDDLENPDFSDEEYITGGNNCRVTSFRDDELFCREFMAENIELLLLAEIKD